jgi:hypothetical protein
MYLRTVRAKGAEGVELEYIRLVEAYWENGQSKQWGQEAGEHLRDDQTRLWACKIGAVRSGDCRAGQMLTIQRARSRNFQSRDNQPHHKFLN